MTGTHMASTLMIVLAVALTGACSHTTTASSQKATMTQWVTAVEPSLTLLAGDLNQIATAASQVDEVRIMDGCQALLDDAGQARMVPVETPDAVQADWTDLLDSYTADAQSCMKTAGGLVDTATDCQALTDYANGMSDSETADPPMCTDTVSVKDLFHHTDPSARTSLQRIVRTVNGYGLEMKVTQ